MSHRLTILLFFFIVKLGEAQNTNDELFKDFNFIIHLSKNKLYKEAEDERTRFFLKPELSQAYRDSVNFFLGYSYYNSGKFPLAKTRLMEVSSESSFFYYKGRFLSTLIDAENNFPDSAFKTVKSIELSTSNDINELKYFELAGTALLKKDFLLFDSLNKVAVFTNTIISQEFSMLQSYRNSEHIKRRKSAFLAGSLSAIVPGLGKVYVGNNGQALATFLTCALMGGIAFENYYRLGIRHPQTIFFTGVSALFYIGNIWGSALSVNVARIEKQREKKHNILVSLKLPVHIFFN
jgi:TM2 domain-containing membrane protein YozV